jgi:hypothetical protein
MGGGRKRLRLSKTVSVGCDRLRREFHGKEGIGGSSPPEGTNIPANAIFVVSAEMKEHFLDTEGLRNMASFEVPFATA